MTHPNTGHKFNRYCLKHGHDWERIWTQPGMQYILQECRICGARQTRFIK